MWFFKNGRQVCDGGLRLRRRPSQRFVGAPRIHGELLKLAIDVRSHQTVGNDLRTQP